MAVNLSPVAGAAAQFFDNSGNVLTGGKLYTYSAGTTTPAVTYTSSSGITFHPNPIILNAAGRVPDSGEIWLSDSVSYKFVLKDQNDVLIGTYDNLVGINSNFVNFTGEEEQQTATQGQTIFTLTTLAYQPSTNNLLVFVNGSKQVSGTNYQETSSTVVTFVDGLNVGDVVDFCTATPINTSVVTAADVSYNQGGTGAVNQNVEQKLQQTICVDDFGAVGDGVTDDTAAIQAAITFVGQQDAFLADVTGLEIYFATNKKYYVAGTLYLPSYVKINLNGSTLIGQGTNTLFESGYFSGGVVVSNFGQPNDTQFVVCSSVFNGQISNFNKAFYLFNFCEDSYLENLRLFGCNQAIYAKRCFYSSVSNVHARSPLDNIAFPCFHFDDSVNAIKLQHNFAVAYDVAWQFSGSKDNLYTVDCGAETCAVGIQINDATSAFQILGWYFENAYTAINFSNAANHKNIHVEGCWFNGVVNAIQGNNILNGTFSQNNALGTAIINIPANFTSRLTVEIPTDVTATNVAPTLPVAYSLGDANLGSQIKQIYDTGSGTVTSKLQVFNGRNPFCVSNGVGNPVSGTVAGCTTTLASTTIVINTSIYYLNYEMVRYAFVVIDSGGTYTLSGDIACVGVYPIAGLDTKTVSLSNSAGFMTLTISGLTTPTSITGVVRHL